MRHRSYFTFALCALGIAAFGGCADNQIGRPCNNLGRNPNSGVTFVNPAPDCPTRLCMVTPPPSAVTPGATGHDGTLSICTADCRVDDDCATAEQFTTKDRCSKYVCAVPSVIPGEDNFCCRKLCVCQDDLVAGFNKDSQGAMKLPRDDDNVAIPSACTNAPAKLNNGMSVTRKEKTCRYAGQ